MFFVFLNLFIFWCNSERKSLSGVSLLLLKMFHIVVTMIPQTVADTSMVRFHLFIVFLTFQMNIRLGSNAFVGLYHGFTAFFKCDADQNWECTGKAVKLRTAKERM